MASSLEEHTPLLGAGSKTATTTIPPAAMSQSLTESIVHIPFSVPRIPHLEGSAFWDNWTYHAPSLTQSQLEAAQAQQQQAGQGEDAPGTPPLAVRVFTLGLLFVLVFGPTLSYSTIGSLYTQLKSDLGFTDAQLGLLFSVYALPNIIGVFFAGVMVDNLGVNFCCILFSGLFLVGNIVALGQSYWFLLIGRLLYGLGTECVSVVQDTLIARWYSHDTKLTLSLTLAVCMLSFRLSSFISMAATPYLYAHYGFFLVLLVMASLVAVSFISGLGLVAVDKKYDSYLKNPSSEEFSWLSIFSLPLLFWMLVVTAFGIYGSILPFISFSSEVIQQKWGMSDVEAVQVTSVLYLAAALVMVPLGFLIDRYGRRVTLIFISCVLPLVAYTMLLMTKISPVVCCLLLGVTHGLFPAAVFPSIALIVPPHLVGSAYGIITCAVNAALFLSPFMLGLVPDWLQNLDQLPQIDGMSQISLIRIEILMAFAFLGCCGSVASWLLDAQTGNTLERTCVLKLGAKVDENLLRQSQQMFESQKLSRG